MITTCKSVAVVRLHTSPAKVVAFHFKKLDCIMCRLSSLIPLKWTLSTNKLKQILLQKALCFSFYSTGRCTNPLYFKMYKADMT